jgi:hypothetical protein
MIELKPIPDIRPGLREAAQRGILIPFIGAGASRLAGCPGWADFADRSIGTFMGQGKFTHAQFAQVRGLSPRVKLSIVQQLEAEHGVKVDYRNVLSPDGCIDTRGKRLFGALGKLGKTFVTTNYDEWLDDDLNAPAATLAKTADGGTPPPANRRNVLFGLNDLTAANLNRPGSVIHLHGSVKDATGMILTTRDYVRHYANDRNAAMTGGQENVVLTFLDALFKNKVVLFVGYGLEELEILEYVILKARHQNEGEKAARHFILQGFYSHEAEQARFLREYYLRDCGIELIPFLMDEKGYEQLMDVLDDLAATVPSAAPLKLQKILEMGKMLDE